MDQYQETEEEFMVEGAGPLGLFGLFEQDDATGYLYLYDREKGVLKHHWVYNRRSNEPVTKKDVEVRWIEDAYEFQVFIKGVSKGAIRLVDLEEQKISSKARA